MSSLIAWYAKGEVGEQVLDIIDQVIDGNISSEVAERELKFLGLSEEEAKKCVEEIGE